ncbi:MAG TPA: C4-dicarboxylate ABC transporter, partial [Thalassospira sp.]|nr:C4-dicarboxylate ABC transporter [Thalassospira sp.]
MKKIPTPEDVKSKQVSRRSFLTKGATGVVAGGAAASGLFAAPAVHAQPAPLVVKMQTSWPSSDIWMTFAKQYADRVEAMSGGRLKVDLLPAGAVIG